jgi:hypothetical protein
VVRREQIGWPARGDALKRLRKAAKRQVRDKSSEIVQKLLDLTLEGDLPSAKMLVSLIGDPSKKKRESRRGEEIAIRLAAEPQLEGPDEDDYFSEYREGNHRPNANEAE